MEQLSASAIEARLATDVLGRTIHYHAEIGSTNVEAVRLARQGAPDGTLVIADSQSAGKGRLGRQWFSPPGSALLFSLLLRAPQAPALAQRTTMVCTLGATRAIAALTGVRARIKWPNDLVVAGRKLGGVLTELGVTPSGALDYAVVGVGLNVNLDPAELPEVMAPPTSLLAECGRPVSRLDLLVRLLLETEALYLRLCSGWSPHEEWRAALDTIGQQVQVGTPEDVIAGVAVDVTDTGALVVEEASGARHVILAGDVTLRGHRLAP